MNPFNFSTATVCLPSDKISAQRPPNKNMDTRRRSASQPRTRGAAGNFRSQSVPRKHHEFAPPPNRNQLHGHSSRTFAQNPPGQSHEKGPEKNVPDATERIICPMCSFPQKSPLSLVRHVREFCKLEEPEEYCIGEILSNAFFCMPCNNASKTSDEFLSHISTREHVISCKKRTPQYGCGEKIFCSFCEFSVPCSYIQMQSHLQHDLHRVRSEGKAKPNDFLKRNINIVYTYSIHGATFKCLVCLFPSVFSDVSKILKHITTDKHKMKLGKNAIKESIYCSFCKEEVIYPEVRYHFAYEKHALTEKQLSVKGQYYLCFFCGFSCQSRMDFHCHVAYNCTESKATAVRSGVDGACSEEQQNTQKANLRDRRILVKITADVVDIFHAFKKFGRISHVEIRPDNYFMMEFENESAVAEIRVRNCIMVKGEQVTVRYFEKAEGPPEDILEEEVITWDDLI